MAETITWVAADGGVTPFDRTVGIRCTRGPAKRFAPPVSIRAEEIATMDGAYIASTKYDTRTLDLQLAVEGTTATQCRTRLRDLIAAFAPDRGAGRLQFAAPGGDTRELECVYTGGLEGDDSLADPALTEYLFTAQFYAADPFFRATTDTTGSWDADTGVPFFPMFPLSLSSSEIFASATVTNDGDIETYPVWTITGPFDGVSLTHLATDRRLVWGGTLGAGESLTIDCRDRQHTAAPKSVTLQDGTDVFAQLTAWDFFPLQVGSQSIQIEAAGATAASLVTARWRHRYYGA